MKTALREQLLSQRLALSEPIIQHYEMSLIKQIRALPTYQLAKRIGLYMPIKKEPNLLALMQDDKWFYVPITRNRNFLNKVVKRHNRFK
jgi:5-formyltetrahydrofolate cyclo-ligase